MKHLIVLNSCQGKKNFVFERLYNLGYTIYVANSFQDASIERFVSKWIITDTHNIIQAQNDILRFYKENKVDGILTFWEDDVLLTARVNEEIGLPGVHYSTAKNIRNKFEFRKTCILHNIPTPAFISLEQSINKLELNKFPFPGVIKPSYGASSAYITKCCSVGEVTKYYREIKKSISVDVESALHDGFDLYIESFVSGVEIDLDIVIQSGQIKYISITDNVNLDDTYFQEKGQSSPSSFNYEDQRNIKQQAIQVIEKIGLENGCIHFEAKFNEGVLIPIEINLRMGGDEVWYFNNAVYGVDLIDLSAKVACGIEIADFTGNKPLCQVFGEYILPNKKGIIKDIILHNTRLQELGVIELQIVKKIGDHINLPPDDFSFIGWYIAKLPLEKKITQIHLSKIQESIKIIY